MDRMQAPSSPHRTEIDTQTEQGGSCCSYVTAPIKFSCKVVSKAGLAMGATVLGSIALGVRAADDPKRALDSAVDGYRSHNGLSVMAIRRAMREEARSIREQSKDQNIDTRRLMNERYCKLKNDVLTALLEEAEVQAEAMEISGPITTSVACQTDQTGSGDAMYQNCVFNHYAGGYEPMYPALPAMAEELPFEPAPAEHPAREMPQSSVRRD